MGRAAADDRSRGKSYSNANAASPRAGKCNRQASHLFELLACNENFLWEGVREGYLFFKKRYPSLIPSQRKFAFQACSSKSCGACRSLLAARSEAALSAAIRLASAPTTRCCAAVGGSAALRMRHTPCGCRFTYLVEVRSNHRLPEHSSMRRAQQCRYFASSLPPCYRHSRLTTVRRG